MRILPEVALSSVSVCRLSVLCRLSVCLLCQLAKTALKGLKSCSVRVMTPLKLVCYFQKCFQKFKTAATTAVTAVVAVYYIKIA